MTLCHAFALVVNDAGYWAGDVVVLASLYFRAAFDERLGVPVRPDDGHYCPRILYTSYRLLVNPPVGGLTLAESEGYHEDRQFRRAAGQGVCDE